MTIIHTEIDPDANENIVGTGKSQGINFNNEYLHIFYNKR